MVQISGHGEHYFTTLCPRYAKKAAIFMKKTGLLGQFKALRAETGDINVTDAF